MMKENNKTKSTNEELVNRSQNSDILGSLMNVLPSPLSDSGYSSGEQVVKAKTTRCEERRFQQRKRERMIDDANAEIKNNHSYYYYLQDCDLLHLEVPEEFKINGRLASGMKSFIIQTKNNLESQRTMI